MIIKNIGWVYRIIITHNNGNTDELTIIDAHTYECNRKLYTGHGLDVALLDRVSGIDR